jgi:hypothetical protein
MAFKVYAFMYGFATFFNALATLSLPVLDIYIAQINFNEPVNGSLNDMPYQNITSLRVSLAAYPSC